MKMKWIHFTYLTCFQYGRNSLDQKTKAIPTCYTHEDQAYWDNSIQECNKTEAYGLKVSSPIATGLEKPKICTQPFSQT